MLLETLNKTKAGFLQYIIRTSNQMVWYSNKEAKEEAMIHLDISEASFFRFLKFFEEKNILIKTSVRGKYKINEELYEKL